MIDLENLHSSFRVISLVLCIIHEYKPSSLPWSELLPSVMDCNDGRSIQIISFNFIQYFRLLLIRIHRMHKHPMYWIVDLEDLIIQIFNISSIPRITNEPSKKLSDFLPIVPIWMDCNCGRFFNSNSPPKSLKLYLPIWMDSSNSQFNMWNDFDSSFPLPFFLS